MERVNRRAFLRKSAAVAFSIASVGRAARGGESSRGVVRCGVIGTGTQGRVLLSQLSKMEGVEIAALCDIYPPHLKKGLKIARGNAKTFTDYRRVIEEDLEAIIIATPPNLHAQMALDALQAGKHVFCESPLALTVEDCKKVAAAARTAKTVFQVGHQRRSSPLYRHSLSVVKAGLIGDLQQVRAQWHINSSWRKPVRDRRYEKLLNWRLYRESSGGLMGEFGSHQLDIGNWFLGATPVSVMGVGGINRWKDGREVYDNVQLIFNYPNGVRMIYSAMLNSSFEGNYEMFIGTAGTILLMGGRKGLLFKEPDAAAFGWEMYAKKERLGEAEGILLDANATKLEKKTDTAVVKAGEERADFYREMEDFLHAIREGKDVPCNAEPALKAAVACIRANECMEKGQQIQFAEQDFKV